MRGTIFISPFCCVLMGIVDIENLRSAEYFFSAVGSDQVGTGTQLNPWRSIDKFNSLDLEPGDNVFFRAGDVFNGILRLDLVDSGTDLSGQLLSPIRISSYGGGAGTRAVFRSPSNAGGLLAMNNGGIELSNLEFFNGGSLASNPQSGIQFTLDQSEPGGSKHFQHIRLDNVIARGFRRSGLAIYAAGNVGYEDVEITNSQFYSNQFAGIDIAAGQWTNLIHKNVKIRNVAAYGNPGFAGCNPHCGHGMVLGQVDNAVIEQSTAHSNGLVAGKGNVGIWTWQSNDVTIQNNTAYGNRSPNGGDGGGFDIDGGVTNSLVQYNKSFDNAGAGFLLAQFGFAEPMSQNIFRYNLSVNDGIDEYGSFTIWGQDAISKASSTLFHNNTAVVNGEVAPNNRGLVYFLNNYHTEIDFINNAFVALSGAALIGGNTTIDQAQFANNAYWTGGQPLQIGESTFESLFEWAVASQQEMLNGNFIGIEADPLFGTDGTYRLGWSSELVDSGMVLEEGTWPEWLSSIGSRDLYGTSIPQDAGLDIGAVEFERIPGDYNGSGQVDAADYVLWRRSLGGMGMGQPADGNVDGMIDAGDFEVWRSHFGAALSPSGTSLSASAAVPESTVWATLSIGCLLGAARARLRQPATN